MCRILFKELCFEIIFTKYSFCTKSVYIYFVLLFHVHVNSNPHVRIITCANPLSFYKHRCELTNACTPYMHTCSCKEENKYGNIANTRAPIMPKTLGKMASIDQYFSLVNAITSVII